MVNKSAIEQTFLVNFIRKEPGTMQGTEYGLGGLPGTTYNRPLEEHSFSTNYGAGGTPTPQESFFFVGWAGKPVLAMQLHKVQSFP